jgi:NhaC family Na+:H+ antiporter
VLLVLSLVKGPQAHAPVPTDIELHKLADIYHITPLNLLPLLLLGVLSFRKVPAVLALMASTLFAGVLGAFLQPAVMGDFVGKATGAVIGSIKGIWLAMANGFSINSGIGEIDRLLSRGGMDSMLKTVWLIIGAVTFGTLLEHFGLISQLIDPLIRSAKSTGRLFVTVFATAFGLNLVAGDQYIALVLPAKVFRAEFARRGLAPTNLSRLCADSGTVTSPLIAWNSCGAFMGAVLGVSAFRYLPFAIFCYASPALSVLYGITGFKIEKTAPAPAADPGETAGTSGEVPTRPAAAEISGDDTAPTR